MIVNAKIWLLGQFGVKTVIHTVIHTFGPPFLVVQRCETQTKIMKAKYDFHTLLSTSVRVKMILKHDLQPAFLFFKLEKVSIF